MNYIWFASILLVCILLFTLLRKDGPPAEDCSLLKSGKFEYLSGTPDLSAYFFVKGDSIIEFNEYGEQFTKSVIKWVGPCQLEIRTVSSSYKDYEFDPNYKVDAYVSNVRGNRFNFRMVGSQSTLDFEIKKVEN